MTEGNAVEVTMVLSHALPGNATITFLLSAYDFNSTLDDYTLPESITFGANETSASFTITATQDTDVEGDELVVVSFTLPISGENLTYGEPATTLVTIIDDDTPGMTITPRTLDVDEGGTTTYTVKLNGLPTENVTVAITSDDTDVTPSPTTLTFTSTDWNAPKTVTVTVVEDSDRTDEIVTLSNNPSGAEYDNVDTVRREAQRRGQRHSRRECFEADADGEGGGHDREQLHGGAEHPADGECDGDGRRALRHGRDPVPNHPDLHASELGNGPDGDGEGRQRCGHDERCRHPDPQRDEHRTRLPGHHDCQRGRDGDRQ